MAMASILSNMHRLQTEHLTGGPHLTSARSVGGSRVDSRDWSGSIDDPLSVTLKLAASKEPAVAVVPNGLFELEGPNVRETPLLSTTSKDTLPISSNRTVGPTNINSLSKQSASALTPDEMVAGGVAPASNASASSTTSPFESATPSSEIVSARLVMAPTPPTAPAARLLCGLNGAGTTTTSGGTTPATPNTIGVGRVHHTTTRSRPPANFLFFRHRLMANTQILPVTLQTRTYADKLVWGQARGAGMGRAAGVNHSTLVQSSSAEENGANVNVGGQGAGASSEQKTGEADVAPPPGENSSSTTLGDAAVVQRVAGPQPGGTSTVRNWKTTGGGGINRQNIPAISSHLNGTNKSGRGGPQQNAPFAPANRVPSAARGSTAQSNLSSLVAQKISTLGATLGNTKLHFRQQPIPFRTGVTSGAAIATAGGGRRSLPAGTRTTVKEPRKISVLAAKQLAARLTAPTVSSGSKSVTNLLLRGCGTGTGFGVVKGFGSSAPRGSSPPRVVDHVVEDGNERVQWTERAGTESAVDGGRKNPGRGTESAVDGANGGTSPPMGFTGTGAAQGSPHPQRLNPPVPTRKRRQSPRMPRSMSARGVRLGEQAATNTVAGGPANGNSNFPDGGGKFPPRRRSVSPPLSLRQTLRPPALSSRRSRSPQATLRNRPVFDASPAPKARENDRGHQQLYVYPKINQKSTNQTSEAVPPTSRRPRLTRKAPLPGAGPAPKAPSASDQVSSGSSTGPACINSRTPSNSAVYVAVPGVPVPGGRPAVVQGSMQLHQHQNQYFLPQPRAGVPQPQPMILGEDYVVAQSQPMKIMQQQVRPGVVPQQFVNAGAVPMNYNPGGAGVGTQPHQVVHAHHALQQGPTFGINEGSSNNQQLLRNFEQLQPPVRMRSGPCTLPAPRGLRLPTTVPTPPVLVAGAQQLGPRGAVGGGGHHQPAPTLAAAVAARNKAKAEIAAQNAAGDGGTHQQQPAPIRPLRACPSQANLALFRGNTEFRGRDVTTEFRRSLGYSK